MVGAKAGEETKMMGPKAIDRIRMEHRELRTILAAMDDAAARVLEHKAGALSDLRASVHDLDMTFRAHLVTEESALLPILPAHAVARMHQDHAEQRAALMALLSGVDADAVEPLRMADDARWLVRGLVRDMTEEDAALDTLPRALEGGAG